MKRTTYTGSHTSEISFPLGGIGTGSIGLAGNGGLIDWEIFNRPNKGTLNGHTHFAVKAMKDGKRIDARILCGDVYRDHTGQHGNGFGFGLKSGTMQGFPHFRECTFTGEYPMSVVDLADPDAACTAKMTAFNPLIPHNDRDSSIPAGFFEITVTNTTNEILDFSVSGTLQNPKDQSVNRYFEQDGVKGVYMDGAPLDKTSPDHTDMTLATVAEDVSYQEYWYRGAWFDGLETYWRNFTEHESFTNRTYDAPGKNDCANLCVRKRLAPGESFTARYILAWYSPIKPDQWRNGQEEAVEVRNYYSYLFEDSKAAAVYALTEWERLYADTKRWHDELFASTLPEEVLDAVSATSSVLKTETSIRVGENGDFYGWEGLGERTGSCPGTCSHVWNYAYTMAFLFPKLERSIRVNDYRYNQTPEGMMAFRTRLPFGRGIGDLIFGVNRACADGQLGGVIKTWREWKLCGDNEWLRSIWKEVKLSLEYAWSEQNPDRWDRDMDGVLEGRQHHTLDVELFGPSSWLEGFYLGALKAGAEMAKALGEPEDAAKYLALFEKGKKWCAENLFNGKYFYHKIDLADKALLQSFDAMSYWNEEAGQIKYQIGEGCIIDQLLAQWHADIIGLGELFEADQVETALANMFAYNFKENMRDHYNTFRLFAMNDESGAIICDYPKGSVKPAIPIPYAQESMHGFEYAFAGLLISRGFIEEGLRVVRSVRDRYNGENRNPWNEIECGSNYARSMASFALLPLFAGMKFDMTRGMLGFNPVINRENFRCVWSVGEAWGNVQVGKCTTTIRVLVGELVLRELVLPYMDAKSVEIDGAAVGFTVKDGVIVLDEAVRVTESVVVK